jgi:hypothetical protein
MRTSVRADSDASHLGGTGRATWLPRGVIDRPRAVARLCLCNDCLVVGEQLLGKPSQPEEGRGGGCDAEF